LSFPYKLFLTNKIFTSNSLNGQCSTLDDFNRILVGIKIKYKLFCFYGQFSSFDDFRTDRTDVFVVSTHSIDNMITDYHCVT